MGELLPMGSLVRVTETHTIWEDEVAYVNTQFVIEDYHPGGNPEDNYIPFPNYIGSGDGGSYNRTAAVDKVELVMTPEQMRDRTIPTARNILLEVPQLDTFDGFDVNAADALEGNTRTFYGITNEGLEFAFDLTISNVEQLDL